MGARSLRGNQFAPVMRRCGSHQFTRGMAMRGPPMHAIGSPPDRLTRAAGENKSQPPPACDFPYRIEQPAALGCGCCVVAEDHAAAARQADERRP
jgi:hypothetical protein